MRERRITAHAGPVGRDIGELLEEAAAAPVTGWDFTCADGRLASTPPWDFAAIAAQALRTATTALDMGTGGGEFLDSLPALPPRTVAAETWPPNVGVAAARLAARGVPVVCSEGAADNVDQGDGDRTGRLPFRDGSFDLVLNRHEAFAAAEVARVLAPGGRFLTQQTGLARDQFRALLGLPSAPGPVLGLDLMIGQAVRAGLTVEEARTGREEVRFADVGVLAWYLRMVPWTIPGFGVAAHRPALEALAGRDIVVYQERFLISCRR